MRYLSVCSGIEAATVAWRPLGWHAVGFAQYDPTHNYTRGPDFASAVLAYHYPETVNHGDFTKIQADGSTVDLLVGGTPCQSFSYCGKRLGLDDPRGNLAIEYAALASRVGARWIVWENVAGALSSNGGLDFGCFLSILAECGYGLAYRILDAQYFGVAQQRRRVFVVGYAGGDWRRAAAVLFEPESFGGNGSALEETRRDVARCVLTRDRNKVGEDTFVQDVGGIRRLTERERERLQGFPVDYTAIEYRGKPASAERRHKAIGNSMAVPAMRWIGERIQMVEDLTLDLDPSAHGA